MNNKNLFLDTSVAVKKIENEEEGDKIRKFLNKKIQFLSEYSITEFKKTFVEAAIHLKSMIDEPERPFKEIYWDVNTMKSSSNLNESKLGRRLEIILGLLEYPYEREEVIKWYLNTLIKNLLISSFINEIKVTSSITDCTISKNIGVRYSNKICSEEKCKIEKMINDHIDDINKIERACKKIKDSSFNELKSLLAKDLTKFDKKDCGTLGDIIIALDCLDFNNKCLFCTTDHHFDVICPTLGINKFNPITGKN